MIYGDTNTYKHHLDIDTINEVSSLFNRSKGQVQYLFELCEGDYSRYMELEIKIKNNFITYCPGTKDDVNHILSLPNKSNWFKLKTHETKNE